MHPCVRASDCLSVRMCVVVVVVVVVVSHVEELALKIHTWQASQCDPENL